MTLNFFLSEAIGERKTQKNPIPYVTVTIVGAKKSEFFFEVSFSTPFIYYRHRVVITALLIIIQTKFVQKFLIFDLDLQSNCNSHT
jgi:hypothetical protein